MIPNDFDDELIDYYEARFNLADRQARRQRRHQPKKSQREIVSELADLSELISERYDLFEMSYKPARFEEGWLHGSLRPFYDQQLILDVVAKLKGGKEASVYRCVGHPTTGHEWLAAKVYRPRKLRNLRNDKQYRQGRAVLTADGRAVKRNDHRMMRALGKKSDFGAQVAHTSWLMHEFTTLQRLHAAGAAVPEPIAAAENAILMGYRGSAQRAAPTLHEIDLPEGEAAALFQVVLDNVERLLQEGLIHGDLSAYNILYWEGEITLIDFPQITYIKSNPDAHAILARDLVRVCDYFARQGVPCDPEPLLAGLWERYGVEEEEFLWPEIDMSD